MPKPRPLSFRRLLFFRLLLLSVPVLLIGEFVVFKKARYTQLENARQNLTESAILKGQKITETIASLKTILLTATQTTLVRSGDSEGVQQFIDELEEGLSSIECVQFRDLDNNKVTASTCGDEALENITSIEPAEIKAKVVIPPKVYIKSLKNPERGTKNKLQVLLSAPVYESTGRIRYILSIKSELQQKVRKKPGLLNGSTVIVSDDGTIIAHPLEARIGTNIAQHADAARLRKIINNAISGKQDSLQFFFEKQGEELVAGYTAINSPTLTVPNQKWVILNVTPLENALHGLTELKVILVVLTLGLVCVCLIAALYIARYLASPVEKLCNYALNINSSSSVQDVPHFQIREFNQLSQAVHQMVERLKSWGEELELAWKDAKTANQVKSQFLATTSHELRNPLNIIINCVRLVREGLCDNKEEELEFLKRADETAIHLLQIINDLLDISKIEAGKLSVSLEAIDLRDILKEVINLQSVNVQQKGLKLNVPDLETLIPVQVDPTKLKQVLINIISNATKFTEEGSITILVETNQSHVLVSVRDTGIGIEPDQQHKLFRPFVMVEGANNQKFGGTGLGLAISRNLIEMMGGKITLESAGINQGTTIKITLPLIDIVSDTVDNASLAAPDELPIRDFNLIPSRQESGVVHVNQTPIFQMIKLNLKNNYGEKAKR
ncbi:MAG: sensor histidine kinase [Calothrix sp. C42_A2020_038]|nr:sensor histidine kinase [Calothrix sp. C42_A2020_038]